MLDFAQSKVANIAVVTQPQLAVAYFLKPPPLKPELLNRRLLI